MGRHQTTILDIARELGLSKSTVSRALTSHPNVHPDTRQRVLDAARRTEYQPNLLAQSLIRSETHLLGVVIPDIEKPFFASIVSGIQQEAMQAGYRLIITQSNESPETEIANLQALVLSRVDGLLVCHTRDTRTFDHIRLAHRKGIPVVEFARVSPELPIPQVVENDELGARTVVRHLLDAGARRIGLLSGPESLLVSQLRTEGYRQALAEAGRSVEPEWIVTTRFVREDVRAALDHWLRLPEPPDAYFAVYDAGAVELMRLLKQRGYRIPEQVQVAGFGNDPVAELVEPPLTTFAQYPREIGRTACRLLLDSFTNHARPGLTIVSGELCVRASTRLITQ
jgi:DNA-binding LacI/PurR family transcriptional regulator